jgi:hypothetical protein
MARKISGYHDLAVKPDFSRKEKYTVAYDILVAKINEYREKGNPKWRNAKHDQERKSLQISKLFGLYMTFLVITV